MAQITEVRLVDDLDGGDAAESIAFSIDGRSYEIDLNEKNATGLRDTFTPFISVARRPGGASSPSRPKSSTPTGRRREDTAAIREWATSNGHEISTRGRIPAAVIDAYDKRGSAPAAPAAPVAAAVIEAPVAEAEAKPKRRARKKAPAPS